MNRQLLAAITLCLGIASCKTRDESPEPNIFQCPSNPATAPAFSGTGTPWSGPSHLVIPNAFSPNGDGKNDAFRMVLSDTMGVADSASIRISDKSGRLVKTLHSPYQAWDGFDSSISQYAPAGYYTLDYTVHLLSNGQSPFKTGQMCLKLYSSDSGSQCLHSIGDPKDDVFEDRIDPKTGGIAYPTAETYCPK